MSEITLKAVGPFGGRNLVDNIDNALQKGQLQNLNADSSHDSFASVCGSESFNMDARSVLTGMNDAQRKAFLGVVDRAQNNKLSLASSDRADLSKELSSVAGTEGFSLVNKSGDMEVKQAPSIALNALSHRQTDAGEAFYKTVTIPYTCEQIKYQVRSAGLGRYVYGASAYERSSELTPVTAILRDSDFFLEDSLKLQPVFPEDGGKTAEMFVASADWTPWDVKYDQSDVLHRGAHKTSFLSLPANIPNLLALSQTPGQVAFDISDEIESNSIKLTDVLVRFTMGTESTKTVVRLHTADMSNTSVGPSSQVQSSDDRVMPFVARHLRAEQFLEKTGGLKGTTPTTALDGLKADGAIPYFDLQLTITFNRQNNQATALPGLVTLSKIEKDGITYLANTEDTTIKALFDLYKGGVLIGAHLDYNTNNLNNTNFGYRVETYNAEKQMGVRKWTPVSIKYPIDPRDVNQEALNFAVENMAVIINNEMSASSVTAAKKHLVALERINGAPIVGNNQGSNVLAAQHFIQPCVVQRVTTIKELTSSQNSQDTMANVAAGILNVISEIVAALTTNSGLAAIQEYNGEKEQTWDVIVHQNLYRYMFRNGDSRSLGHGHKANFIPCNFDSTKGEIFIIPSTKTSGDSIDPMGGVGVTLSKEDIVVEAKMTRDNKDFGLLMTCPSFQQHSLNVIMGYMKLTDADAAMTNDGLIHTLQAQKVELTNAKDLPAGPKA